MHKLSLPVRKYPKDIGSQHWFQAFKTGCIRQATLPRSHATCFCCLHPWRKCWGHQEDPCSCGISGHQDTCSWSCSGGRVPPSLLCPQLNSCSAYTGWTLSGFVYIRVCNVFWAGIHYCTGSNKNKAVLSFFKSHCRLFHSPCWFCSKGISVNFLMSYQNQTLNLKILELGGYFLLHSFQKWVDKVLTSVTWLYTNILWVSLCICSLSR